MIGPKMRVVTPREETVAERAERLEAEVQTAARELLDEFAARRLMRVREQLQRLDDLAAQATDSKVLKELADATTRLAEQERILAGRPLPGSRRPAAEPKRGRPESVGPWVPAVVQPMVPAISPTQPTEPPTGQQADK